MKTRNLLFGAMGLLLMASCAKDEVVNINRDGDEIAFNVVSNASTRVYAEENGDEGVYCNNNLPNTFYVWATHNGQTYIEGDKIKRLNNILSQGSQGQLGTLLSLDNPGSDTEGAVTAWWENQSGKRYWPAEGTLNFYACVNAVSGDENYNFNWNNGAPTIDVTVSKDVYKQKDLLYAVKKDQTKANNSGKDNEGKNQYVNLNFRHALSQIVFQAKNTNPNLYVEIDEVSICNVKSKNTFTYPTQDTDANINHHDNDETNNTIPNYNESWGTWGDGTLTTPEVYSVSFAPVVINGSSEPNTPPTSLTNTNYIYTKTETDEMGGITTTTTTKNYSREAMLLLPQASEAWDPKAETYAKPEAQAGTYFLVKCLIYNIANTTTGVDKTKDICLWGNKVKTSEDGVTPETYTYTTKEVAIPIKLDWTQGKKYIYTFSFGADNGGYDPDPEEKTPVLVPIEFQLTVDDFEPVNKVVSPGEEQGVLQVLG